ncbi:MAG: hypothetical protein IPL52_10960 [Flavobacteriales bacterium]|nr:hypothetical protein [Flavobacteriales bacterium]
MARLYICGMYAGYTDGTINDPGQRFASRLLVEEDHHGGCTATPKPFTLYPNPEQWGSKPATGCVAAQCATGAAMRWEGGAAATVGSYYTNLQLQTFPDGIYIMELLSNGERMGMHRLVVQH